MAHPDSSSATASIGELSAPERYAIFLELVGRRNELWILTADEEAVMVLDEAQVPCLPVWPHRSLARITTGRDGPGGEPTPVDLELFLDRWLPRLAADGYRVAVFPTPEAGGQAVLPERLKADFSRLH